MFISHLERFGIELHFVLLHRRNKMCLVFFFCLFLFYSLIFQTDHSIAGCNVNTIITDQFAKHWIVFMRMLVQPLAPLRGLRYSVIVAVASAGSCSSDSTLT